MHRVITRIASSLLFALAFCLPIQTSAQDTTPPSAATQTTLGGNARELLPDVDNGEVEIIAVGEISSQGYIPVVVQNNTNDAVGGITAKVDVRDSSTRLIAVGETPGGHALKPYLLNPDEIAIGFIYVEGEIPADAVFTYSTSYEKPEGFLADFNVDVEFGEVNWITDRIVGEVFNPSPDALSSAYLMVTCIDAEGIPLLSDVTSLMDEIPAESITTFQMSGVFGDLSLCENFLIAGTGHPKS